jgi:hypothetical protein
MWFLSSDTFKFELLHCDWTHLHESFVHRSEHLGNPFVTLEQRSYTNLKRQMMKNPVGRRVILLSISKYRLRGYGCIELTHNRGQIRTFVNTLMKFRFL